MGREKTDNSIREQFVYLTRSLLDSTNFIQLSPPAVRLLLDIARQYNGRNNGKLLCTLRVMKKRGWNSNDTLLRARRELEAGGFIQQTRLPWMPRRAAWYGITWRPLDYLPEMDVRPYEFIQKAYLLTPEEIAMRHRLTVASSA